MSDRERLNQLAATIKPAAQRELEERTAWRALETSLTALGQTVARAALAAGVEESGRDPGQIRFPVGNVKYVEITPSGPLKWFHGADGKARSCSIEQVPKRWGEEIDILSAFPRHRALGNDEMRRRLREEFERKLATYMSERSLRL